MSIMTLDGYHAKIENNTYLDLFRGEVLFSKNGETVLENLQTPCQESNLWRGSAKLALAAP